MTAVPGPDATPGQPAFRTWMFEEGHDPDDMITFYGVGTLAEAFQAGIAARQPQPGAATCNVHVVSAGGYNGALALVCTTEGKSGTECDAQVWEVESGDTWDEIGARIAAHNAKHHADAVTERQSQPALLADRNELREALRRIALGTAGDPSVAADTALTASRDRRDEWEPAMLARQPQPAPGDPGCPDPAQHVVIRDFLTGRELSHAETDGAQPAPERYKARGDLALYGEALREIARRTNGYDPGTNEHAVHQVAVSVLALNGVPDDAEPAS